MPTTTYNLQKKTYDELLTINGRLFRTGTEFELAAAATQNVQIKTGDIETFLYGFVINTPADAMEYTLKEDPTITDGATEISLMAFNRVRGDVPKTVIYSDPTSISGGTIVKEHRSYIAHGSRLPIDLRLNGNPILLKKNTDYLFALKNNDAGTEKFFVQIILMELP